MNLKKSSTFLFIICVIFSACKAKIKEQKDEIYSRHLQRHIALTVITTPMPSNKEDMNLLIFNGAKQLDDIEAKKIIDSLWKKNLIEPITIVGVDGDEKTDYGIGELTPEKGLGSKAEKYREFINNELYPFAKKKVSVRKFKSFAIAGCSLAGISAFDIAWNYADKIHKIGILSGDFFYNSKGDSMNNVIKFVESSRKRPKMQFWLYAGNLPDSSVLKNTLAFGHVLSEKKSIAIDDIVINEDKIAKNDVAAWRNNFAAFVIWAFGK